MKKIAELVLLYHFANQEKLQKIQDVLQHMKIKVKVIPDDAVEQRVGYLAGLKGFSKVDKGQEAEVFAKEMLILQGIGRKRMDVILATFQAAEIEKIQYKAVVTPHNMFWSLRRLGETMQKEHAALISCR